MVLQFIFPPVKLTN